MRLLSEIQVRYRSNRFGERGKRFGLIEFDPYIERQLDLAKVRAQETRRRRRMRRALASVQKDE